MCVCVVSDATCGWVFYHHLVTQHHLVIIVVLWLSIVYVILLIVIVETLCHFFAGIWIISKVVGKLLRIHLLILSVLTARHCFSDDFLFEHLKQVCLLILIGDSWLLEVWLDFVCDRRNRSGMDLTSVGHWGNLHPLRVSICLIFIILGLWNVWVFPAISERALLFAIKKRSQLIHSFNLEVSFLVKGLR